MSLMTGLQGAFFFGNQVRLLGVQQCNICQVAVSRIYT